MAMQVPKGTRMVFMWPYLCTTNYDVVNEDVKFQNFFRIRFFNHGLGINSIWVNHYYQWHRQVESRSRAVKINVNFYCEKTLYEELKDALMSRETKKVIAVMNKLKITSIKRGTRQSEYDPLCKTYRGKYSLIIPNLKGSWECYEVGLNASNNKSVLNIEIKFRPKNYNYVYYIEKQKGLAVSHMDYECVLNFHFQPKESDPNVQNNWAFTQNMFHLAIVNLVRACIPCHISPPKIQNPRQTKIRLGTIVYDAMFVEMSAHHYG